MHGDGAWLEKIDYVHETSEPYRWHEDLITVSSFRTSVLDMAAKIVSGGNWGGVRKHDAWMHTVGKWTCHEDYKSKML